jgi:peptidoglycan/xylan/chitin deacetylase (PgdA/CDA1 family)
MFRPPLGALTFASLIAPRMAGLHTVLWSVDVDDWTLRDHAKARETGERLSRIAKSGDIILLHDDNKCVVTALETALPRMRDRLLDLQTGAAELISLIQRS